MKLFLRYISLLTFFFIAQTSSVNAQQLKQDSIVQLYGVVMTADSLRAIPAASVIVENKGRGTITNGDGVFSIVVMKGDRITFSSIGFKDKTVEIPKNWNTNEMSVIQLLVADTNYLPATILKPRPTREQFERDFVNNRFDDDSYEIARQNIDEQKRRALIAALPADGREAVNFQLRQQANKYYYNGQLPPMNILNPLAWADFIKAWKRGDFKSKR
ncbi:MAG: carboxypeptidase-like regulatory domain-containing protein [Bacteroidetes bacterium]|nr:carboxypeptidase-like regulatory domain-containing protein [Bacteroidota bacterium]MBS1671947.1 carboxypeptidase-like regulatory domain-containing protein [Bacteroidota bacterium]